MKRIVMTAIAASLALAGAAAQAQEKQQMAFVVNAASDFWKLAEAGVKKAQAELPTTTSCSSAIPPRAPRRCRTR